MMKVIFKIGGEVLEAAVIVVVLYFLFFPMKIDGVSMENSLMDGDRIIICRAAAEVGFYGRDSIVIIDYDSKGDSYDIVKRVAAVEGDTIKYSGGELYINGVKADGYKCQNDDGEFVVGEGQVFVLGDNPSHSTDSRSFGPVNKNSVKAVALLRFYPFNSVGLLL